MSEAERAAEVLDFWLVQTPPEQRFARDATLDGEIARRFADLRTAVVASHAEGWRGDARTLLAAVILVDQFSRNIFRGKAEAFAADPLARALTLEAIGRGWDTALDDEARQFLYMPLMHSELLADQIASVRLFGALGGEPAAFAKAHAAQIARFGRFPGRNAALGRTTTAEEAVALEDGAAF